MFGVVASGETIKSEQWYNFSPVARIIHKMFPSCIGRLLVGQVDFLVVAPRGPGVTIPEVIKS